MNTFDTKLSVVLMHFLSIHEADAVYNMLTDDDYNTDDIIEYIEWSNKRILQDLDTEFESWLEDRKPRVTIGFCCTDAGSAISGTMEFPKRGEDMDHGTEYEWYYSLREHTDEILSLKVGQTIPFKLRDDQNSVGSVTRLK